MTADEGGWCGCCGNDLQPDRVGRFSRTASERSAAWARDPDAARAAFRSRTESPAPAAPGGAPAAPTASKPKQPPGWFQGELPDPADGAETKTCPKCAEDVKAAAVVCRYCGHDFSIRGGSWGTPAARPAPPAWGSPAALAQTTSALAIGAIVCACVGISVVGIILGVMGQREVDRSQGQLGGRGLATAAIWIGSVVLVIQVIIVLTVLVATGGNTSTSY